MAEQTVVIGLFPYASDARRALHVLHEHHFGSDQVTAAFREAGSPRRDSGEGASNRWFGQLRQLYRGDERGPDSVPNVPTRFETMLEQIDLHREDAAILDTDLGRGAAIVTVRGPRTHEAQALLQAAGARIVHGRDRYSREWERADRDSHDRESREQASQIVHSTPFNPPRPVEPGHIQLFGEVLRVHKEKVSSGDVRVRKESTTHMETVQVPVTREHLVVDHPDGGENDGKEALRIPLSEERVHVHKETVLREEYKVGKREVSQNETVTDTVRRDRLLIDDATRRDGD